MKTKHSIQQHHADSTFSIGDGDSARQWDCQNPCLYKRLYQYCRGMRIFFCFMMMLIITMTSCTALKKQQDAYEGYSRYEAVLPQTFDVSSTLIVYATSEKEFFRYRDLLIETLQNLHELYDIYNDYPDRNNLKTINDQAGITPVKVEQSLMDLLLFGKQVAKQSHQTVNIAMGSVLSLWHQARTTSLEQPHQAHLPNMEDLQQAATRTNIEDLILDTTEQTVFLKRKGMSLDVGAIAKGYATQFAMLILKQEGLVSGLLNAGGNVITVGRPMEENKMSWRVGVQHPAPKIKQNEIIDTIYTNSNAIVTSGSYQRFYEVQGVRYHHIISPVTLMPADQYESVTVLCEDGGLADMLSTALFILSVDQGTQLVEQFDAQAMWILKDLTIHQTPGYIEYHSPDRKVK